MYGLTRPICRSMIRGHRAHVDGVDITSRGPNIQVHLSGGGRLTTINANEANHFFALRDLLIAAACLTTSETGLPFALAIAS